ncbi:tRNA synthetases class I-domain-containing protein [Armillaria luteobubalina]|uniref:isoleucine--tRNA ligase n=1 Tax=Armillaria luteobubalina TaxID=153913 RepID=A0AA39Q6Y5_9AGAR|nr:tRNA synthetases class I-domain-containing protein [Armillaria luteobubalina]
MNSTATFRCSPKIFSLSQRRCKLSTAAFNVDSKAFSKTLNLPQTSFPLWPDREKSQVALRPRICEDLYRAQARRSGGREFVLHDGPPYANGNLHVGHSMNKILKDIINRFHVISGDRVQYIPGWDCHGLPIENKALKDLGTDSRSLTPSDIRSAARKTALREIEIQKEEFQQFGIMADWSKETTYRTLDHGYEMRQLGIFQKMVENGLIYRHYRPVHFSPSSRSALAEAELVYKDDHISHSVYVTFDLGVAQSGERYAKFGRDIKLLVWTTTPWTLTANMGIAVNPELAYSFVEREDDKEGPLFLIATGRLGDNPTEPFFSALGNIRYVDSIQGSDLVGAYYKPIFSHGSSKRIIRASHVTSESGTGLVHCAPAHGAEDYNTFRDQGLLSSAESMLCHVGPEGEFKADVADIVGEAAAQTLVGKSVLEDGSRAVVALLKETNSLVKIERFKHKYPYDWRTDKPIIVTATSQWFANLDKIKEDALNALEHVEMFPPSSRLQSFIRSRSEWCISRQRVWGVPIPALYHIPTDRAILDAASLSHILPILQEKGIEYWWNGPVEEFVPPILREGEGANVWRKGTDTMDVWFDSGSSWSMLEQREDGLGQKYRADVCVEGSDQHRGWFQSQLLTAVGSGSSSIPYKALVTHGMVLDQKGKKMSKSLGNVISPITVVAGGKDKKKEPAYGADLLRLWIASVEYWNDVPLGTNILNQTAESLRKIRNTARFLLGNIGDIYEQDNEDSWENVREHMDLADRYMINELQKCEAECAAAYVAYNFPKVVKTLQNLCNITLSSFYFDINKDNLYANALSGYERRATVFVLKEILATIVRIMAPILPHLAQEIHDSMYYKSKGLVFLEQPWNWREGSFAIKGFTEDDMKAVKKDSEDMAMLMQEVRPVVTSLLEQAREQKQIRSSLEAEVDVILPEIPDVASEALSDAQEATAALGKTRLAQFFRDNEDFMAKHFIVSRVTVMDEGSLGTASPEWIYIRSLSILGEGFSKPASALGSEESYDIAIRIRPAMREKCPRCWTFTKETEDILCQRCADVTQDMD